MQPVVAVLRQGMTRPQLARTLATGVVCSLFPFLGTTSALNLVVGLAFRMNQPVLQALNQLLWPVQVALIIGYVRLGEWMLGAGPDQFAVTDIVCVFRESNLAEFFAQFGRAGLHALVAWAVTAPLLFLSAALVARPLVNRLPSLGMAAPEKRSS